MQLLEALIAGFLGLLVGGWLNMLADDLPSVRGDVRAPHYPDGAPRPWLGVLAFLQGKRLSPGKSRLSWRYPLVEVGMALCFIALVAAYPFNLQLFFYLFYAAMFMLVTVIDVEHRLILFAIMIPAAFVALLDALLPDPARPTLQDALGGGVLGFGVFWLFWLGGVLFNKARAGDDDTELEVAFGFGDVMLAGVCGLILGWQAMLFAMFITVFAGAFGGIVWIASRMFSATGYAMFSALPYGPYIVFGTVLMLFFKGLLKALLFPAWP